MKQLCRERTVRISFPLSVSRATEAEIESVKDLLDRHRYEFGFIPKAAISEAIEKGWLLIAKTHRLAGFIRYRPRRDKVTVIYEIVVDQTFRNLGVGRALIQQLVERSRELDQLEIRAKCPVDLAANQFYSALGFELVGTEKGKKRDLNVWKLKLSGTTSRFVCALSINRRDLRKLVAELKNQTLPGKVFDNVLISPLFSNPDTVSIVRRLKDEGIIRNLYFDSGGYQVQKGIVSYHELCEELFNFYLNNRWADYYVLPDYPPTSLDVPEVVQQKVRFTVNGSRKFYWDLPSDIGEKTIAVVQGRSLDQVLYCVETYKQIGIQQIGFGSFGTRGADLGINVLDDRSVESIVAIRRYWPDVYLHAFGVGNPPTAYVLSLLGVTSFDSSGWIKAAGYGNIYFPYSRAYNVSFKRIEKGNGALTEDAFMQLKRVTGHWCRFCEDFYTISTKRDNRLLHNLICMMETVSGNHSPCLADGVIMQWAPNYKKFLNMKLGGGKL